MPTYDYRCLFCGATKEVVHSMAECQEPSPATLEEITCRCPSEGRWTITRMERYLGGAPALGKIAGMTPGQRREVLLKRSRQHFQKEVREVKEQKTVDFLKKGREKAGM